MCMTRVKPRQRVALQCFLVKLGGQHRQRAWLQRRAGPQTVEAHAQRRDPWVLPVEAGARRAAAAARGALAAGAGGGSDHLALVRAFNGWSAARGGGGERRYAAQHSLSGGTLAMVDGMRSQLLGELVVRPPAHLAWQPKTSQGTQWSAVDTMLVLLLGELAW